MDPADSVIPLSFLKELYVRLLRWDSNAKKHLGTREGGKNASGEEVKLQK